MYVQVLPQAIQPLAAFLSVMTHFENVSRGVVDSRDVIYYLSVTVVGLLIATTALESRKWK
jgi:ABC-2 type transport system permease protein